MFLEKYEEQIFNLFIADIQMPEMDGIEFLKVVREDRGSDITFIIFTGKGREEVAMEALNMGVDQYHIKEENPIEQFKSLTKSILEEVVRIKGKKELEGFHKKIKELREDIVD